MSLIGKLLNISRSVAKPKDEIILLSQDKSVSPKEDGEIILLGTSECLSGLNRAQVNVRNKQIKPDSEFLKKLTNKYSQTDAQISQTKQDVIDYLNQISMNLEEKSQNASSDEVAEIFAQKAVVDYLSQNIKYDKNSSEQVGFTFALPTKKINRYLDGFDEEFQKSVELFKKAGIFDVSEYDPKKYQFDADVIMDKYEQKDYALNNRKYQKMFHPVERLKASYCDDPYLNDSADFYRIISIDELVALLKTKKTNEYIDSNGHYTNGHYSCITTNPNYNEQAFAANGVPIRLKFKTREDDGSYNMDLLNRIAGIKQERSIYKVCGYNYYDIDWNNLYVSNGAEWEKFDKATIDELTAKL